MSAFGLPPSPPPGADVLYVWPQRVLREIELFSVRAKAKYYTYVYTFMATLRLKCRATILESMDDSPINATRSSAQ